MGCNQGRDLDHSALDDEFILDAAKSKKLQGAKRGLSRIPDSSFSIDGLEEVWLQENSIEILPKSVERWKDIELFYAFKNDLAEIPIECSSWKN